MDARMIDLYRIPDIASYEDVRLMTLRENCAALEEKLQDVMDRLPDHDRYILAAYLDLRDDLEVETVKVALRLGKRLEH